MYRPRRLSSYNPIATTRDLIAQGYPESELTRLVRSGELIRVRRGYYALPGTDVQAVQAVRVGGRLSCVSALALRGVWVTNDEFPHISMPVHASRIRTPRNRHVLLKDGYLDGCTLHWWGEVWEDAASVSQVSAIDAVIHTIRCQPPELAVAVLDSALHENVIYPRQLDVIFAALPRKYRRLRSRIDSRCMSGIETIIRLELTALGIPFELQVLFNGIGSVDFVVDGRIVVETDGRKWHEGLKPEKRDYYRDVRLAALGYQVLRFNYRQVMFHRGEVIAAILAALDAHRGPVADPRG